MRALQQLIRHDPDQGQWGDCHRTCVAAILELDHEAVPHFFRGVEVDGVMVPNPDWAQEERDWLAARGLGKACFYYMGEGVDLALILKTTASLSPGIPMILGGRSSLGCNHSVVIQDGEIVCDPSGNGIVGPCDDGCFWVAAIAFRAPLQSATMDRTA